jgi:hypothetical protein
MPKKTTKMFQQLEKVYLMENKELELGNHRGCGQGD